ncbi:hypothetical protein Ddye_023238 [Dipteronia dyeriana]|uniref:HAT C-terminal dimerisation domain-containing protein n=1 Tax=Dipteronia dyeriana TaxID=168575 RepID=A0AAD9WT74_9ROSI|nr:hypothetical protein Ddye_023238 [Dipteronia dyeriana]
MQTTPQLKKILGHKASLTTLSLPEEYNQLKALLRKNNGNVLPFVNTTGPTNLDRGNGPLQNLLEHEGIETDVLSCCNSVNTFLYELYDEYLKIYGPSLNISVSQPQPTSKGTTSSSQFKLKGLGDRLFSQRAKKLRASSSSSNTHSELDGFLEANHVFLEDKFSIQGWWKDYEQEYPILAIIAKQILGTLVSTVAVEQEFSAGGNILDPRRSVLCPQSLEAQTCVDDWIKAKFR